VRMWLGFEVVGWALRRGKMVAVFGFVWFVVEISSLGDYEWACGCSAMG
jgi:hypothetical protein